MLQARKLKIAAGRNTGSERGRRNEEKRGKDSKVDYRILVCEKEVLFRGTWNTPGRRERRVRATVAQCLGVCDGTE
jgi:hypothetical protein